jgi:hypothetical protein
MRQSPSQGGGPEQRIKLVDKEYCATSDLWAASKVGFGGSELYLSDALKGFEGNLVDGDFFKLTDIVVSLEDIDTLSSNSRAKSAGGRPAKTSSSIKIAAHALAFTHHVGMPTKQNELVAVLQEYTEGLPEEERLGKTKIQEIVREIFKQIAEFDE